MCTLHQGGRGNWTVNYTNTQNGVSRSSRSKIRLWLHKNEGLSISFLEVFFPTPPLLVPYFYDVRIFLSDFLPSQNGIWIPRIVVEYPNISLGSLNWQYLSFSANKKKFWLSILGMCKTYSLLSYPFKFVTIHRCAICLKECKIIYTTYQSKEKERNIYPE